MLQPAAFHEVLEQAGVTMYAGVPDSLLKDFCAFVTDHVPSERHVITVNEGAAVALAMGHHLATGGLAAVYMQNSGLGNAVNPLTSLADPAIYGIPMLLVVGWRGEPGTDDEPQHVTMGAVTEATLRAIGVPFARLPQDLEQARSTTARLVAEAREANAPRALVVSAGTFGSYALRSERNEPYALTREQAITAFVDDLPERSLVVATTGKPSRELFEVREARGQGHASDLLTVGGMGHASLIALGVALEQRERRVYCLDGDGAVLMHLGSLATIGSLRPRNYRHLVVNNAAHDSVGGQPTVGFEVDLCAVAAACGYPRAELVTEADELGPALRRLHDSEDLAMLEVRIRRGARSDLGRPTMSPAELKAAVMGTLAS